MRATIRIDDHAWALAGDLDQAADLVASAVRDGRVTAIPLTEGELLLNGAHAGAVAVGSGSLGVADDEASTPAPDQRSSKMGRYAAPPEPSAARSSKMGRHGAAPLLTIGGTTWRLGAGESDSIHALLREAMETGGVVDLEVWDDSGTPARLVLRCAGLSWVVLAV